MQTALNSFYPSLDKQVIARNPIVTVYPENTENTNSGEDSEPELIVGIALKWIEISRFTQASHVYRNSRREGDIRRWYQPIS